MYRDTDAVVSGKITKRRMTGETFSAAYNLRTVFSCESDPACDVQRVVDADLTAESGALDLVVRAPTFVFRVSGPASGSLRFHFYKTMEEIDQAGILVMTPVGVAHCADNTVELPPQAGSYAVWVRAQTPGTPVAGYGQGHHRVP